MLYEVFNDSDSLSKEVNTTFCYRGNLPSGFCFLTEHFEYCVKIKNYCPCDFTPLIST